jgi:hypothetical protein
MLRKASHNGEGALGITGNFNSDATSKKSLGKANAVVKRFRHTCAATFALWSSLMLAQAPFGLIQCEECFAIA